MKPIDKFEIEPRVWVKIYPEDDPDWSWVDDDDEQMKRAIRRGDLEQYLIVVSTFDSTGEVEGSDSLGEVVVGYDDHKQEIREAIEAYQMIENAKLELKTKIEKILEAHR